MSVLSKYFKIESQVFLSKAATEQSGDKSQNRGEQSKGLEAVSLGLSRGQTGGYTGGVE